MTLFLTLFATSFVVALSGAIMPGPLLTITISESSRRGVMTGPLLIVGHAILELALVVALLMDWLRFKNGTRVYHNRPGRLCGAAVDGHRHAQALPTMTLVTDGGTAKGRNLILSGIILSLVNPYWSIWWASIGLGYIIHSMNAGTMGVIAFFTGHILGDLFWYAAVSTAIWRGRRLLSDRGYRVLIGTCAVFLIVFSCLFAWSGVQKLIT